MHYQPQPRSVLFVLMAYLVKSDQVAPPEPTTHTVVDVMGKPKDSIVKQKPKIKPMPEVKPQPKLTRVETPDNEAGDPTFNYQPGELKLKTSGSDLDLFINKRDNDARPIVRINPKYPIDAARNGVEGWVILAFDINAIGEVVNIKIVDSQPKRIFDKAARRALSQWKYQAKSVSGKTVAQQNFTVQLDFNMEQSS